MRNSASETRQKERPTEEKQRAWRVWDSRVRTRSARKRKRF